MQMSFEKLTYLNIVAFWFTKWCLMEEILKALGVGKNQK